MTANTKNLLDLPRETMAAELAAAGEPEMRARQLWHWVYHRGTRDFDAMGNLPKALRERLAERYCLVRPALVREQHSADGSRKWLLKFADGNEAETVFIPDDDRGAVCVSSQVGCTLTCTFCHTGRQRLVRNLTVAEIVGQLMIARDAYDEWPTPTDNNRLISNVVLMGMGEPLFNYDNVAAAIRIITDPDGIALSKRRITLSTSGVVPLIARVGAELGVNLAVSLHAVTDELRDVLVPINRKYPIAQLLEACRAYPAAGPSRRITFEYVMLKDVNDSAVDAKALLRLVAGIPAKFNIIPFNPWPGAPYESSSASVTARFASILTDGGYESPIRVPRGRDIMAACGQLRSESERERLSRHRARLAAGIADDHTTTVQP